MRQLLVRLFLLCPLPPHQSIIRWAVHPIHNHIGNINLQNRFNVKTNKFPNFHTAGLLNHLEWLMQLSNTMDKLITFGCGGSEPFALLWILGASEIKVVEKDANRLTKPMEELELLKRQYPTTYKQDTVDFIIADMSAPLPQIPSDYFELAFCESVLYYMEKDIEVLQRAINQMARVVRPGGWIIVIEHGIEQREINQMFGAAGLMLVTCPQAPPSSYCFKKAVA